MIATILSGAAAWAKAPWRIAFNNMCNQSVKVAMHYADANGEWVSDGFWIIEPGATKTLVKTSLRTFYYYAQSDGTRWMSTDYSFKVAGNAVPFHMKKSRLGAVVGGVYTHRLNCPNGVSGYQVRVANYCAQSLQIAVRYVNAKTGEWVTSPAYRLAPKKRDAFAKTSNRKVWVHASYGSKYFGRSGKRRFQLNGEPEWFFPFDLSVSTDLDFCSR